MTKKQKKTVYVTSREHERKELEKYRVKANRMYIDSLSIDKRRKLLAEKEEEYAILKKHNKGQGKGLSNIRIEISYLKKIISDQNE